LPEYDLIGHVTLGLFMLEKSKDSVKIDDVIFGHLMHIIQSHGEAWAVHLADYASATLREVSDDLDGMPVGVMQYGKRKRMKMYRFDSTETGTESADDDDGTAAAAVQSANVTRAENSRQTARESESAADEEGYGSGQTRLW